LSNWQLFMWTKNMSLHCQDFHPPIQPSLTSPVQFRIRLSFTRLIFKVTSVLKKWWRAWGHGLIRPDLLNGTSRSRSDITSSYSIRPGFKYRPWHKSLILWVSGIFSCPSCKRTVLTSTVSPMSCSARRYAVLCNYQTVSISCHTVLTSTISPMSCSAQRCAILCNYQPVYMFCHTVLTSTVSPMSCSALRCAAVGTDQPVSVSLPEPTP
jgi:hypothetical protein